MPVKQLQEQMDSREFAEWIAYSNIEPIGAKRGDFQAALIACVSHNALASAFGGKMADLNDFVLKFDPPRQQTPEEIRSRILLALGGNRNGNVG